MINSKRCNTIEDAFTLPAVQAALHTVRWEITFKVFQLISPQAVLYAVNHDRELPCHRNTGDRGENDGG